MNEVIRVDASRCDGVDSQGSLLPLPTPGSLGVTIRDATLADVPFIDGLQKIHNKAVGWMPTAQLEGHIAKGHVLIAEEIEPQRRRGAEEGKDCDGTNHENSEAGLNAARALAPDHGSAPRPQRLCGSTPLGYCIGVDKYFKREDTGIIYQMNITPGRQRGLVGATLLKAMFERCPYGVKLFCCWCAQDLEANHFWEAMGFVPLAFRAGSAKRVSGGRVHIFWQKRIREGDTQTEWWYPSQTGSGAIREDRIVLPIPPGTHWSDAKPRILPGVAALIEEAAAERKALQGPADKEARARQREAKKAKAAQTTRPAQANAGGLWFGSEPRDTHPGPDAEAPKKKQKPAKNDPRLVSAARELRDRWMEKVAAEPGLIAPGSEAKYEISRQTDADEASNVNALPGARLLDAA